MTKAQRQFSGEKIIFAANGAGRNKLTSAKKAKKKKINTDVMPFTKINSKWMIGLM